MTHPDSHIHTHIHTGGHTYTNTRWWIIPTIKHAFVVSICPERKPLMLSQFLLLFLQKLPYLHNSSFTLFSLSLSHTLTHSHTHTHTHTVSFSCRSPYCLPSCTDKHSPAATNMWLILVTFLSLSRCTQQHKAYVHTCSHEIHVCTLDFAFQSVCPLWGWDQWGVSRSWGTDIWTTFKGKSCFDVTCYSRYTHTHTHTHTHIPAACCMNSVISAFWEHQLMLHPEAVSGPPTVVSEWNITNKKCLLETVLVPRSLNRSRLPISFQLVGCLRDNQQENISFKYLLESQHQNNWIKMKSH